jgi:hypothetical protein
MRKVFFPATMMAAMAAMAFVALTGTSCGGEKPSGDLPTLNLAAAIDNPRPFDLAEIAESIEFIPLDDSDPRSLMSEASRIAETKSGFYIADNSTSPVKLFDRSGRFVATRGSIGRGPNEYLSVNGLAADYDTDRLWVTSQSSLLAYDADGRMIARNDSVSSLGRGMAWFDGRLMLMKDPQLRFNLDRGPAPAPAPDSVTTIIDLFTPDLRRDGTIEAKAKGTNYVLTYDAVGNGIGNLKLYMNSNIIYGNGEELYFKEGRSDTVFRYVPSGAPIPAFRLDGGKYAIPDEAYLSYNPDVDMERYHMVSGVLSVARYTFVWGHMGYGSDGGFYVFDRDDPAGGFSAIRPDGKSGLSLDGISFTQSYVRDGRLVGYMQALHIVDAAEAGKITRPDLAALAAKLKEDSNPVIVVVELKK